ncbi:MAG: hypothetical protein ACLP6W_22595 [Bryobacteraceae bacterium]
MRLPDLVLLNITAVVGVRWLAVAARTGPGSITLWVPFALPLIATRRVGLVAYV